MQDELFEPLTFESPEQIKERFRGSKEKLKKTIKEPEPPPKPPELVPIWKAYNSISTNTPEKFTAWLRLRPPREDRYVTFNKTNDVETIKVPALHMYGKANVVTKK